MTREPGILNGKNAVFSINSDRKTGQSQAEEWNCNTALYHSEKLTWNGLKI